MNRYESAAVWTQYVTGGQGIAITSGYTRIVDALTSAPQRVFLGRVKYLDWDNNLFLLPFSKRMSSNYENNHEARDVHVQRLYIDVCRSIDARSRLGKQIIINPGLMRSAADLFASGRGGVVRFAATQVSWTETGTAAPRRNSKHLPLNRAHASRLAANGVIVRIVNCVAAHGRRYVLTFDFFAEPAIVGVAMRVSLRVWRRVYPLCRIQDLVACP